MEIANVSIVGIGFLIITQFTFGWMEENAMMQFFSFLWAMTILCVLFTKTEPTTERKRKKPSKRPHR